MRVRVRVRVRVYTLRILDELFLSMKFSTASLNQPKRLFLYSAQSIAGPTDRQFPQIVQHLVLIES